VLRVAACSSEHGDAARRGAGGSGALDGRVVASVMGTAMQWELPPAVLLRVFRCVQRQRAIWTWCELI
jgi:hypothetical protein